MSKKKNPKWLPAPQKHDYPAAVEYLSLLYPSITAARLAKKLNTAEVLSFHAKDIFRASKLVALADNNHHVKKNISKIKSGEPLSPILLVKDDGALIIADGYHRLCAAYLYNEDMRVPCQIVNALEV